MTIAERLREEGRQQGIEEGRQEGTVVFDSERSRMRSERQVEDVYRLCTKTTTYPNRKINIIR